MTYTNEGLIMLKCHGSNITIPTSLIFPAHLQKDSAE